MTDMDYTKFRSLYKEAADPLPVAKTPEAPTWNSYKPTPFMEKVDAAGKAYDTHVKSLPDGEKMLWSMDPSKKKAWMQSHVGNMTGISKEEQAYYDSYQLGIPDQIVANRGLGIKHMSGDPRDVRWRAQFGYNNPFQGPKGVTYDPSNPVHQYQARMLRQQQTEAAAVRRHWGEPEMRSRAPETGREAVAQARNIRSNLDNLRADSAKLPPGTERAKLGASIATGEQQLGNIEKGIAQANESMTRAGFGSSEIPSAMGSVLDKATFGIFSDPIQQRQQSMIELAKYQAQRDAEQKALSEGKTKEEAQQIGQQAAQATEQTFNKANTNAGYVGDVASVLGGYGIAGMLSKVPVLANMAMRFAQTNAWAKPTAVALDATADATTNYGQESSGSQVGDAAAAFARLFADGLRGAPFAAAIPGKWWNVGPEASAAQRFAAGVVNAGGRGVRSYTRWTPVWQGADRAQKQDQQIHNGERTWVSDAMDVVKDTADTAPVFAMAGPALFSPFGDASRAVGQGTVRFLTGSGPTVTSIPGVVKGTAKVIGSTLAIPVVAATGSSASKVVRAQRSDQPVTPNVLVPRVFQPMVGRMSPELDAAMNLGDRQQQDVEVFQAFRAENPDLPETEALRAYTSGNFKEQLNMEMAKLPKDATDAQKRKTRMHVLGNMFRSSGTADLSMLADMDFMKSIGCEDASIDEIRGIARQTLVGNIAWTKGQQGIGAMWDAAFKHTDVDNVISAMSENQDVRLLVSQYGTMEAMLMCRDDYKPGTGQDSRLTEAFFSTMTDKNSAAQFAQQVLGKASPEAFGNFITHARAADTGDKKMSEGQVNMTNACLSMFGAKCQEDGDFARQALPLVQQSLAKGGALTQLDPRVEQHMANMLDSLDYDRIMDTIDNDKEAIQFCDYLASQKGQNSFMKMPPEQQKAIMGRIESAAQTRCWEAFKRDPLGTAPLLASLWLKNMGLDGVADAVKNPAVFYGGLLLVVGGGIALLAGGDDDDDDDDDRAYKKRLKTDSEDAFYERIARGA